MSHLQLTQTYNRLSLTNPTDRYAWYSRLYRLCQLVKRHLFQTVDTHTRDNKTRDNKTMDNKTMDNKTRDNKTRDNKIMDNKIMDKQLPNTDKSVDT